MPRFYCPLPLSIGVHIELPESIVRHLHVLRLSIDERITLFNGEGGEYIAVLSSIEKKRALAEIISFSSREAELAYAMTLAQALPEASKMDWIIEKAVELGITAIQPIVAQRCVVRLDAERTEKKLAHWQGILAAASEQSGRNRLPHLAKPIELQTWLTISERHTRILLTPRAELSLSDWAKNQPPQPVALLIGPEGGFTEQEEKMALAQGAVPLSMGSRILRTETAGLAALASLNAIWGEM